MGQIMTIKHKTENNEFCEINFFWELARAKNISEFNQRILSIISRFGLTDFAFGRLNNLGIQTGSLHTTHQEFLKIYESEEFHPYNLVVKHGHVATTPIFTSAIERYINDSPFETETFKRNHDLIRLCKCYGYYDFYNIPIKAFNGTGNAMLSVSTKKLASQGFQHQIAKHEQDLDQLTRAIDYVGTRKFPSSFLNSKELSDIMVTPKPLELLNTLAKDNITLKNAANQLGISLDTANKHIANIKHALGANTQAAAVYRAIKEGLIEPNV